MNPDYTRAEYTKSTVYLSVSNINLYQSHSKYCKGTQKLELTENRLTFSKPGFLTSVSSQAGKLRTHAQLWRPIQNMMYSDRFRALLCGLHNCNIRQAFSAKERSRLFVSLLRGKSHLLTELYKTDLNIWVGKPNSFLIADF